MYMTVPVGSVTKGSHQVRTVIMPSRGSTNSFTERIMAISSADLSAAFASPKPMK